VRAVGLGVAVCTTGLAVGAGVDVDVPHPASTPAIIRPATIGPAMLLLRLVPITLVSLRGGREQEPCRLCANAM
jgi:hypothetical protein